MPLRAQPVDLPPAAGTPRYSIDSGQTQKPSQFGGRRKFARNADLTF